MLKGLIAFGALCLAFGADTSKAEPAFVPVYADEFPDPFVLLDKGGFIAYATNNGVNLPMMTSADLVHWQPVTDPARPGKPLDGMPTLAPWAKAGNNWAPEVLRLGDRYILYYMASARNMDRQCVGAAVADNPRGPFRDNSEKPLVCQSDLGGSIDPDGFRDSNGKLYLYFKNDGNRINVSSAIYVQELSADGLSLLGSPTAIERESKGWEGRIVEAPSMIRAPDGGYKLFFSGGAYTWDDGQRLSPYAMGYANCATPVGPCVDAAENPILHSFNDRDSGCLSGPGHQAIFAVGSKYFIAFHAWAATKGCRKADDKRFLYVAPLSWKDGKPVIGMGLRAH